MAANRLEPIDLTDFTGGLNLRRDQFTLGDNESPDMLNVDVDPRGGFYTRRGWHRWNGSDITTPVTNWRPRNSGVHNLSSGAQIFYVGSGNTVWRADESTNFVDMGIAANGAPHQVDGASWGDAMYLACGTFTASQRVNANGSHTTMTGATWSEVDAPVGNTMPMAQFVKTHAGYLFVANISEGAALFPSRIRWSHPNRPDAFRELDYLDIDAGGGKITAIISFSDHLLIFKTGSLWALYGYGDDSWQLVKVSSNIGCPTTTAVTRSETAVYFFSASNRGGIYGYSGQQPTYISEKIAPALEAVLAYEMVFVSWAGRRLWVSVPWHMNSGAESEPKTLLVFDPTIGQGSWSMYRSEHGAVTNVLDGSDVNAKFPLASFWSDEAATMVVLDVIDNAYDVLLANPPGTQSSFEAYYRTRWLHAGWPDRLKSWRRPMFVCRRVPLTVDLLVEQFRDYDEISVRRTGSLRIPAGAGPIWTATGFDDPSGKGFDWTEGGAADPSGRGADWGEPAAGAQLLRGGPMGHARALQLRVGAAPYTALQKWGVDGIVCKTVARRFRT